MATFIQQIASKYLHLLIPMTFLLLLGSTQGYGQNEFITVWDIYDFDGDGTVSETITIPTFSGETYNYTVNWGDGSVEQTFSNDAPPNHTYTTKGMYEVTITGKFPRIYFNNSGSVDYILEVKQWGTQQWTSMAGAFHGCYNLSITASDAPNLSQVTDMNSMFKSSLNGVSESLNRWNVAAVTNMSGMFQSSAFNSDISGWNVSNVTNMSHMFYSADSFNQDISTWNVSRVTNMSSMFSDYEGVAFSSLHFTMLLLAWAELEVQSNIEFGDPPVPYCSSASTAVETLKNTKNWTFDYDYALDNGPQDVCEIVPQVTPGQPAASTHTAPTPTTITLTIPPFQWGVSADGTRLTGSLALHYKAGTNAFAPVPVTVAGSGVRMTAALTYAGGEVAVLGLAPGTAYRFKIVATPSGAGSTSTPSEESDEIRTYVPATGVSLNKNTLNLNVRDTENLIATVVPAGANQAVTWSSSDDAIATVDKHTGLVTAVSAPGSATITATSVANPGQSATANVTVSTVAVTGVTLNDATLFVGNTKTLVANILPAKATNQAVTWSSSDEDIATIDANTGLVTAKQEGNTEITVTTDEGSKTTTATVTVIAPRPFITVWRTSQPGETITIPTTGAGYSYQLSWNKGDSPAGDPNNGGNPYTGDATHTYATAGEHEVTITGKFPRIFFNAPPLYGYEDNTEKAAKEARIANAKRIIQIKQWGTQSWTSMRRAFTGCSELQIAASDHPNLSKCESMESMFEGCKKMVGHASMKNWNTSSVTDMSNMFNDAAAFDQDISGWEASKVLGMYGMFNGASSFNQPLNDWNVSSVTDMSGMFEDAVSFNQSLNKWNVSSVGKSVDGKESQGMSSMFQGAKQFNQPLNDWNVASVENMSYMFKGATLFDQPLDQWNISNVKNMYDMFHNFGGEDEEYSFSIVHYTQTLIAWAEQEVQENVNFGNPPVHYCASAEAAVNTLINAKGWDFKNSDYAKASSATPAVSLRDTPPSICAGEEVALATALKIDGSATITLTYWETNTNGVLSGQIKSGRVSPTTTTKYYVKPIGCGKEMDVKEITINIAATKQTQTLCEGAQVMNLAPKGATWYSANQGGSAISSNTALAHGTKYYRQCGSGSLRLEVMVQVSQDNANFYYGEDTGTGSITYAQSNADPTPKKRAVSFGIFSSYPSGLALDPATGRVDLSESQPKAYTITYTLSGKTCPEQSTEFLLRVTASEVLSLESPTKNALQVSPIPTTGRLDIRLAHQATGNIVYRLSTLLGNVVWQCTAEKASEVWEQSIDLGDLSQGIYMLEVITEGQHWTRKVVKE